MGGSIVPAMHLLTVADSSDQAVETINVAATAIVRRPTELSMLVVGHALDPPHIASMLAMARTWPLAAPSVTSIRPSWTLVAEAYFIKSCAGLALSDLPGGFGGARSRHRGDRSRHRGG